MTNQSERLASLDILRIISALAVITIHVTAYNFFHSYGQSTWWLAVLLKSLSHWAVPIFIMISGALFLNPERKMDFRKLLYKKLPHLLFLYIFWWVAYFFLLTAIGYQPFTRAAFLKPSVHLWFLPMLAGLYLIVPFLRQFTNNKQLVRYFLLLWLVFTTVELIPQVARFTNAFKMSFVMKFSGYFVLGYYLFSNQFTRRQNRLIYLLGIISALVIVVGTLLASQNATKPSELFIKLLSPQYIFLSAAIFLFVKNHSRHLSIKKRNAVDFLQKYTLGIYLVHRFWIKFIATESIRHCCSPYITMPAIIIVVAIFSFLTVAVLLRIPVVKKIVQ